MGRSDHSEPSPRYHIAVIACLLVVGCSATSAHSIEPIADLDCPGPGCPLVPAFNAADIEAFFKSDIEACRDAPDPEKCLLPKIKSRSVCIGTSTACAEIPPFQNEARGFELLITFETGSSKLTSHAKSNLKELAAALNSEPLQEARVDIDGHTDGRGNDAYNLALSQLRADSVVAFLAAHGVSQSRLQSRGFGESEPRVEDAYAPINRRVEATVRLR